VCMDITDPRNPRLLWERTYTDLEMTSSYPSIVRVKDKWFAVFGSGPDATAPNCDGTSTKKGHIFVVDLEDGNPHQSGGNDWLFETNETNAFMNSPVSLDKNMNNNVDAIYFGETYFASNKWKGKLYKVAIPWVDGTEYDGSACMGSECTNYSDDPLEWQLSSFFDAGLSPITAAPVLSVDSLDNAWVYVGSGRYFNTDDKLNTDQQYLFGIKDPFFNEEHSPDGDFEDDYYHNYSASLELGITDLLDADDYVVSKGLGGKVYEGTTHIGSWNDLLGLARAKDGWIRSLTIPGERVLEKPAILGGTLFATSFVPNDDVCEYGGDSYLYALFYETGTAYYNPAFSDADTEGEGFIIVDIGGESVEQVLDKTSLGSGKSASVGIHVGEETGAKGYTQLSTGEVFDALYNPAFNVKSGLRSWQEK